MTEKITFRKARDLGDIFGSAFKFIKLHFRTFYGSILLFAGPFLIAGTLAYGFMSRAATATGFGSYDGLSQSIGTFVATLIAALLALLIGGSVYTVVLNKNIMANEALEPGENLKLSQVSQGFFKDYWRVLLNLILFSLIMVVTLGLVVLLIAGLVALVKEISYTDNLANILIVLFVIVFFIIFVPILSFIPTATIFVCQRDRINIFTSLGKVMGYMKGNFWNTWIFSVLALLTYSVMAVVVQIPSIVMTTIATFTRVKNMGQGLPDDSASLAMIIVTVICSLLVYMVLAVFYLMNIYHYTSLEEKKEGSKLIDDINQIV